jgi:hypothetical protein
VAANRPAALDVLVVHCHRLGPNPRLDVGHRRAALHRPGEDSLHSLDGPEQVDGRWPRRGEQVAGFLKLDGELLRASRLAALHRQRHPHRRAHADGRRAPDDHGLDGAGHIGRRPTLNVLLDPRELPLVDHEDCVLLPANRRMHRSIISAGCR